MKYGKFSSSMENWIMERKDGLFSGWTARIFPDGFRPLTEEEKEFVWDTNRKYSKSAGNALIGDFLCMKEAGAPADRVFCRFSVRGLYDRYMSGSWGAVEEAIRENIRMARDAAPDAEKSLEDANAVRSRLTVRLINFPQNRMLLKGIVCKRIGDIAQVLYLRISDRDDSLVTMKVPRALIEGLGISEEEAWDIAIQNANAFAPPRLYMDVWETVDPPEDRGVFMSLPSPVTEIRKDCPAPVLTTYKSTNGAVALLYPGVADRIAHLCGGSYYVAFTSIHDMRVHPMGAVTPLEIVRRLKAVNNAGPEDMLTKKAFIYDAARKELAVAEA